MTTRAELRTAVRRRLEDTGGTPLWDDATLNDLIADAIRRYGMRCPAERSITQAVVDGARSVTVTTATTNSRVVRVFDAAGELVPRARSLAGDGSPVAQGWRWWNGQLVLANPAAGGNWQIELLGVREIPANDVAALDLEPGDDEIVLLMTVAGALRRRAVEDAKRGNGRSAGALLQAADGSERAAEQRFTARRRQVSAGWLAEG